MTRQERIDRLIDLGYLQGRRKGKDVPDQVLEAAKAAYAVLHGIPNDWTAIEQSWQKPRCALPDIQPLGVQENRWEGTPEKPVTWAIVGSLPNVSDVDFKATAAKALGMWQAECGIVFQYTTDANRADIVMTTGVIDQAGGTLAWSELPPAGGRRRLTQKYDTRERWLIIIPSNAQGVYLLLVILHECGHVIGLYHSEDRGDVMFAMYNEQLHKLQPGDIRRARKLYGPSVTQPGGGDDPTPDPTPGGTMGDIFKKLFGAIFAAVGPQLLNLILPAILEAIKNWITKNAGIVQAAGLQPAALGVLLAKAGDDAKAELTKQAQQAVQALSAP